MSIEFLKQTFEEIPKGNYAWFLYFFRIDRRSKNPYKVHKVRFKKPGYLTDYANHLVSIVLEHQIAAAERVQDYNGENSKTSCDKLPLADELIHERWQAFVNAVANSGDEKLEGKINGYIVTGHPALEGERPSIVMVKAASPLIELNNKKALVYKRTEENELDLITDDFYRLYLNVDFLVAGENLYTFNHNFERIFEIEKTLSKIKNAAAEKILQTNSVSNKEEFAGLISQYKSPKTFITLNEKRLEGVKSKSGIEKVANILKIPTDENGALKITEPEEASLYIRYLCYKIFQEQDTNDVLEANYITKIFK